MRRNAVRSLGKIGDKRAIPHLKKLLERELHKVVREKAKAALKKQKKKRPLSRHRRTMKMRPFRKCIKKAYGQCIEWTIKEALKKLEKNNTQSKPIKKCVKKAYGECIEWKIKK